jgi:hypothetical protein
MSTGRNTPKCFVGIVVGILGGVRRKMLRSQAFNRLIWCTTGTISSIVWQNSENRSVDSFCLGLCDLSGHHFAQNQPASII